MALVMSKGFLEDEIPVELRSRWQGAGMVEVTIGRSSDRVFSLNEASAYLKVSDVGQSASLANEKTRLDWLKQAGVAVPQVLGWYDHNDRAWLEMTAIEGANAVDCGLGPCIKVDLIAKALRQLHEIKIDVCPFDEGVEAKLTLAALNAEQGLVDEQDFDPDHLGISAKSLLERVYSIHRKWDEDKILTHGDACMPNIILNDNDFSGFVDCGKFGLADRYQDLALAARSIQSNLGAEYVQKFFATYGIPIPDERRLYFYRLLDEFF